MVFDKAGKGIGASEDTMRKVKSTFEILACMIGLGVLSTAFTSRLLTKQ